MAGRVRRRTTVRRVPGMPTSPSSSMRLVHDPQAEAGPPRDVVPRHRSVAAHVQRDGVDRRHRGGGVQGPVDRRALPGPAALHRAAHEPAVAERQVAADRLALEEVSPLVLHQPVVEVLLQLGGRAPVGRRTPRCRPTGHRACPCSSLRRRCHRVRWPTRVAAPSAAYCTGVAVCTVPRIVLPRTISPARTPQ